MTPHKDWLGMCVAACCSALCCSMLQRSVLQCHCSVAVHLTLSHTYDTAQRLAGHVCCSVLQCSVLQYVAVQCIAVCDATVCCTVLLQ